MPHASPIPPEPTSAVYLAVADRLKAHPLLAGRVTTWRLRDGQSTDDDPATEANLPWVRLTPVGLPAERDTRTTHMRPVQVQVEIAVARPGGSAALLDLANKIESALFRRDHAGTRNLWAAMRSAGGSEIVPGQPAMPVSGEDYGPNILTGRGYFQINTYVRIRGDG